MSTVSTLSPIATRPAPAVELPCARGPLALQVMARSLLLAALFAAPWAFGAVLPWGWAGLAILTLVALLVWVVACAQRGTMRVVGSPLYGPFLGFLVLGAVQLGTGWTYDRVATREALLKISTDVVLFFLAGQLFNTLPENGKALRWLGLTASLLCFGVSTLALAQFFTSSRTIYWRVTPPVGWPFGPYVNHNHYGGLMEMLIPLSAGYLFSRRARSAVRYFSWILLAFPAVSVPFSGSRGAMGVLVIEGLLLAVLVAFKSPRSVRGGAILLGGLAAGLAIAIFVWLSTGHVTGRMETIIHPDKYMREEVTDRLAVSQTALRIFASHPGLGVGLGCFEYAFPTYANFATEMHWTHAHDDYVELLAEGGLPAGLLLVWALVIFLRSGFRHLEERLRHESGWIQIGATVACVGLLCHSFLDFNFRVPANAAWFVVCLAVAVHPRAGPGLVRKTTPKTARVRQGEYLV